MLFVLLMKGAAMGAGWANACGDGRVDLVLDGFEDPKAWTFCCADRAVPAPALSKVKGCAGGAIGVRYNLTGGDWLVIQRSFNPPINLSNFTHLRVALRASNTKAHHTLQLKLKDAKGDLYWIVAESVADAPVWRIIYVDTREFRCFGSPADCKNQPPIQLSAITGMEIGIARCLRANGEECEPGAASGTLYIDELAAVDLRPGAPKRLVQTEFEPVLRNPDFRASAANAILKYQNAGNGLVPAWFDETVPNYNTYSQAIAMLVFVQEWQRTASAQFAEAANRIALALMQLQIPTGAANAGAWHTAYTLPAGSPSVVPFDSSCTGNERSVPDIDRCMWIGNTGWAVIALDGLRSSNIPNQPPGVAASIAKAAAWMTKQRGRIKGYPGLATIGLEGNISAYFGLLAAGKRDAARRLGDQIYKRGWDAKLKRMKIGAGPNDFGAAMDMAGSWGVQFLLSLEKRDDALLSAGYAATVLRVSSFGKNNPARRVVNSYGDIAGPWTVATEFVGQAAAAGIRDSNAAMTQIYALRSSDGSFRGSTDNWFGGTVAPWTTTMRGVAPTAWIYFAQNADPLAKWKR